MINLLKSMLLIMVASLLSLVGCADYTPVEPPPGTGTVFQNSLEEVQTATRNTLTKLSFAITKESAEYIEAVHLKPGETVEKNDSELVGIWFKPRQSSVLVLIDTVKTPSGIAGQREWEQSITRQMMKELQ